MTGDISFSTSNFQLGLMYVEPVAIAARITLVRRSGAPAI
jgi:hypothetical protein